MARRRFKRRIRAVCRHVAKHRRFYLVLVLLFGMWWCFDRTIRWTRDYSQRIAALEEELAQADFASDPNRYISLQRSLDFERVEPFFFALFLLIPVSFLTVLILCIFQYSGRNSWTPHDDSMEKARDLKRIRLERKQQAGNA